MTALEEIKKALEGVTPGPWHVYSEKVADKAAAIAESAYQVEHTEPFVGEIFMLNAGGKCPALTGCGPCSEANARYIAAVNPATISELLFTLESLQRENEELRRDLSHEASHRQKLQNALAYWMPGVTEEIEISTNGRCGDDALLLVGSDGPFEDKCWGNEAIARAEAAEAEVRRYRVALIAAKTRMRNCRGAIESDQVVDKDVHGSLQNGIRDIQEALASTGGKHHGN